MCCASNTEHWLHLAIISLNFSNALHWTLSLLHSEFWMQWAVILLRGFNGMYSTIISWNLARELNQTLKCAIHWTMLHIEMCVQWAVMSLNLLPGINWTLNCLLHCTLTAISCHFTKLCKRIQLNTEFCFTLRCECNKLSFYKSF